VALPGLRLIAAGVAAGSGELREDLDSEVLTGFCTALSQADPDDDRVLARLYWAAERAGRRRRAQEATLAQRSGRELPSSTEPRPPTGHPDLVLAAAVRAGVLTGLQAELICQTRLEKRHLREVAAEFGLTLEQLRRRRRTRLRLFGKAVREDKASDADCYARDLQLDAGPRQGRGVRLSGDQRHGLGSAACGAARVCRGAQRRDRAGLHRWVGVLVRNYGQGHGHRVGRLRRVRPRGGRKVPGQCRAAHRSLPQGQAHQLGPGP